MRLIAKLVALLLQQVALMHQLVIFLQQRSNLRLRLGILRLVCCGNLYTGKLILQRGEPLAQLLVLRFERFFLAGYLVTLELN